MAELEDKRREVFAAAVARGLSKVAAHREAGFAGDTGNAARMAREPAVMARIEELRAEQPPVIEVAAAEPQIVPLAGMHNGQHQPNRIKEFEAIRDQAMKLGHTSAATMAQAHMVKAERVEQTKGKEAGLSLVALAQKIIPHFRWALRTGGTAEEMACRILGIVSPTEQAALGVPLAKRSPSANGHAKA
jgi:hypothetical protein